MRGCNPFLRLKTRNQTQIQNLRTQCYVFICHRGVDTKRTIAGLLHRDLDEMHKIPAFLDCKTLNPGDNLYDMIHSAIHECKIGVIIFSPRFCESIDCLRELALLVKMKKKLIPIFCDVKADQLQIIDNGGNYGSKDLKKFRNALEKAKNTVGIEFDTSQGDWPVLLRDVSALIIKEWDRN